MVSRSSQLIIVLVGALMLGLGFVPAQAGEIKKNINPFVLNIPQTVQDTILKEAGGNVTEVEKIDLDWLTVFKAEWVDDNNEVTIYVAKNGKVLCRKVEDASDDEEQGIDPNDFVTEINNPYFPLTPGTTFFYEGTKDGDIATDEMYVTHDSKEIIGVTTVVVRDRAFLNGELVEETFDWYGQDKAGNVWYFGEDAKEYENGVVISTEGSWEAGVDGAKPGIAVEAEPYTGDLYRQEYAPGIAEDMGQVLRLNETVTVPYGTFKHCLKTKDYSLIEPGIVENKYYAPGIGFVFGKMVKGGSERTYHTPRYVPGFGFVLREMVKGESERTYLVNVTKE